MQLGRVLNHMFGADMLGCVCVRRFPEIARTKDCSFSSERDVFLFRTRR